jgi:hypothetical protein
MNERETPSRRSTILTVVVPVLLILFPLGYSVVSFVFARSVPDAPFIERADAEYESCVREVTYMRYHHWELLKEIREAVVRDGVRGDISLNSCRGCHPNRERFCNQCHQAVNLEPDCFGCHYYPATPGPAPEHAGTGAAAGLAGDTALLADTPSQGRIDDG